MLILFKSASGVLMYSLSEDAVKGVPPHFLSWPSRPRARVSQFDHIRVRSTEHKVHRFVLYPLPKFLTIDYAKCFGTKLYATLSDNLC